MTHHETGKSNPCRHYIRKYQIWCSICSNFFGCRHCHENNQIEQHHYHDPTSAIEPHNIVNYDNRLKCMECGFEQLIDFSTDEHHHHQPITSDHILCTNCGVEFGKYNCKYCLYFGDEPIYHCAQCKVCYKSATHSQCWSPVNCVICLDVIDKPIESYRMPNCTHTVHRTCMLKLYFTGHDKCPVCRSGTRLMEECSVCCINLFKYNFTVELIVLDCGHKLHVHCASSLIQTHETGEGVYYFTCHRCATISKRQFTIKPQD
jgi:RING finger/CHY zinc finger protein 1